ncbi:MFS transporter [Cnuibacter physcomitrellae]|uniref:MFS transporter n=1 Tax=Cnuibacter physcomitrellae TaxID=1619308 RepID=UPI0021760310|nr:MFS transporter [Cnuibacter physcomitrellae]MCS5498362.1 MFS transporter [Cnuibacter physcomitrellae]
MTSTPSHAPSTSIRPAVFSRLSAMMLLQFMTYGAWWATLGLVLTTYGMASIVGVAYSLAAIGAMVSPLVIGAVADRFFSSQKVLAVLSAVSGLLLFALPPLIESGQTGLLLVVVFIYMLFFQPTISISNSIAFAHVPNQSNAFAYIRAFGTAGWIIIGLVIGQSGLSASTAIFTLAAVISLVLAVYALTLPNTPPPARGKRFAWGDVIGVGAFRLFRQRSFVVLVICLLLAAIPISIYNSYGSTYLDAVGIPNVASFMTIGQITEVLALLLIPLVLRRFTMKVVLMTGLVAWVVRSIALLMMTGGNIGLAVVVVALHGICSDFLTLAAFMFVDSIAKAQMRAQAQALVFFIAFGLGNAIGSLVAGELFNTFVGTSTDVLAWQPLWYIVGGLMLIAAVIMGLFFTSSSHGRTETGSIGAIAPKTQARRQRAAQ